MLRAAATEALDLGHHAASEAIKTMFRIINTGQYQNATLAVACAYLQHKIDGLLALDVPSRETFQLLFENCRREYNEAGAQALADIASGKISASEVVRKAMEG